jgi:O-antigen/teichoic acid export membrane protein
LLVIFGLDRAVVRFVAHYLGIHDRQGEVGVIISGIRLLCVTTLVFVPLFWLSIDLLTNLVFHKPDLLYVLRILGLGLPFIAFTRVLLSINQAYKQMTPYVVIEQVAVPVMRIAGLFLLVLWLGVAIQTAALSFTLAAFLGCLPAAYFALSIYNGRRVGVTPRPVNRQVLQFAWLAMLSIILNRTNTQTETLVLGSFSTSEQVGIYTVGLKATVFISIFLDAIATVFAPYISDAYAKKDMAKLAEQYKTVTRWAFTLALPMAIALFIESPDLMTLLGPGFASGALVLRILAVAQIAYVILGPGGLMLMMTDYNHLNFVNAILNLVLSIGLDFLLIPRFGAIGAAVAGSITIVFVNLLRLIQIYYFLHMHPYSWNYLKPFVAGLGAFIAAVIARFGMTNVNFLWRLIGVFGIAFLVYGCLLLLLRLEDTDRELIQRFVNQLKSPHKVV